MTSSSKKSRAPFIFTFTAIVALFAIVGGAYYIHKQNRVLEEMKRQEQIRVDQAQKEKLREELQALFDSYLNDFKDDLRIKVTDYKKTRELLREIKSPFNFETQEYAKENYTLFKKEIAPSLRRKSAEVIEVFKSYTNKIEEDLKDKDNDLQQIFLKKWKDMSFEQLETYVAFFSKEEDLIQAYDELITFYYTHSRLYKIDVETNTFEFSRKKDEKKAEKLLEKINQLQQKSKR